MDLPFNCHVNDMRWLECRIDRQIKINKGVVSNCAAAVSVWGVTDRAALKPHRCDPQLNTAVILHAHLLFDFDRGRRRLIKLSLPKTCECCIEGQEGMSDGCCYVTWSIRTPKTSRKLEIFFSADVLVPEESERPSLEARWPVFLQESLRRAGSPLRLIVHCAQVWVPWCLIRS